MINTLIHGDCLEVMRGLPDASVDAVVTDPPYMIGSISVGNAKSKAGTWADMENAGYWFAAWFSEAKRLLKPTGYLVACTSWRSVPTLIFALSKCRMPATSCLVWDKEWIGPASPALLRPRYEMAMFSAMPDACIPDRTAADIFSCKWNAGHMKTTPHPAEKPVALMEHLISLVTPPGGTVLDPFLGSGTTGVAAVRLGFGFIGIEREAEYMDIARARIASGAVLQNELQLLDGVGA